MNRKNFIKTSGYGLIGLGMSQFLESCSLGNQFTPYKGKSLVILRVLGGMDGFHLVSIKNHHLLNKLRPNLQKPINEKGICWINDWYIHHRFSCIRDLIDKNWLKIIPNVGYPDYNRLSHFKAQDYWETGSVVTDDYQYHTGWIGRKLDKNEITVPSNPNPVLIMDNEITIFDKGERSSGVYYQPFHPNQNIEKAIKEWLNENNKNVEYYDQIENLFNINSQLKNIQPKIVDHKNIKGKLSQIADCIEKELPFSVYNLTQSGYDTHHKQSIRLEPLALELFEGLNEFAHRLQNSNKWNDVTVLVYTEFGRTLAENSNAGTDHGTANHTYLLGGNLIDKFDSPSNILQTVQISDVEYLQHQIDFREIYRTVI